MTTTDPKLIERAREAYDRARAEWAQNPLDCTPKWDDTDHTIHREWLNMARWFEPSTAAAINEAAQKERAGILETVLNIRAVNGGNFDRKGAAWEAYDRACLDIHAAIEAHKESQHG